MFGAIFNFFESLIYIVLFIVFIPNFFFTLPSDGKKMTVAAVHGILYSLAFAHLCLLSPLGRQSIALSLRQPKL
jgi:hypothetical protein